MNQEDTQKMRTDNASEQIDNGLLRHREVELVHKEFTTSLGIQLTVVDARQRFLDKLAGIVDPERKRKIIGNEFISVFQETATQIEEAAANPEYGNIDVRYVFYQKYFSDLVLSPETCLGSFCSSDVSWRSLVLLKREILTPKSLSGCYKGPYILM